MLIYHILSSRYFRYQLPVNFRYQLPVSGIGSKTLHYFIPEKFKT